MSSDQPSAAAPAAPAAPATAATAATLADSAMRAQALGWWLGALGVLLFALTIPMTRLASGSLEAPQLPAVFVAIGRAALAGLLAIAWLLATRAAWPSAAQWRGLALTALGVVFGFPLFLGLAVQRVDAAHAAVVAGLLPMATAAIGVWLMPAGQHRPGAAFWACAGVGTALVVGFAAWQGGARLQLADGLLLAAVACGGFGYVMGARLSTPPAAGHGPLPMPPQQVISWVLVLCLPVTVPVALATWPSAPASAGAWGGFLYVSVVSMWLGFFAWYRGLQLGGMLRVSQIQLLQPFLSMLLAVPLLGEALDAVTLVFALAVMCSVLLSRRLAAGPATTAAPLRV